MRIKVNFGASDTLINAKLNPSDMTLDVELTSANQQIPVSFGENTSIGEDTLGMRMNNTLTTYANDNITEIPNYCFSDCTNLTSIETPNVRKVYSHAFANTGIITLVFPHHDFVTSSSAFQDMHQLKTVDIPSTLLSGYLFRNCRNLETLILRSTTVVIVSASAFTGTPFASGGSGGTAYVPNSLLSDYQTAWLDYSVTFQPIEGSPYEHYYADGTPVE